MRDIRMRPIGIVHTEAWQDEIRGHRQGMNSEIEIFPEFEDALEASPVSKTLRPASAGPNPVRLPAMEDNGNSQLLRTSLAAWLGHTS